MQEQLAIICVHSNVQTNSVIPGKSQLSLMDISL